MYSISLRFFAGCTQASVSNRTPQDWVSLTVKHFRAELNYPQGTWARATIALYSTKTRKHLVAYEDSNLHPMWVALDSKNGQVKSY